MNNPSQNGAPVNNAGNDTNSKVVSRREPTSLNTTTSSTEDAIHHPKEVCYLDCCDGLPVPELDLDEEFFKEWASTDPVFYEKKQALILKAIKSFPITCRISGASYGNIESTIEKITTGDPVELISDWESPYFKLMAIDVKNRNGEHLGYLDPFYTTGGAMFRDLLEPIACLLPHIHAYVDVCYPRSTLTNLKRSRVFIRLELNELNSINLNQEIETILSKPVEERSLSSIISEVR